MDIYRTRNSTVFYQEYWCLKKREDEARLWNTQISSNCISVQIETERNYMFHNVFQHRSFVCTFNVHSRHIYVHMLDETTCCNVLHYYISCDHYTLTYTYTYRWIKMSFTSICFMQILLWKCIYSLHFGAFV